MRNLGFRWRRCVLTYGEKSMPIKTPDPIYEGDDYPRDGCAIVVEIGASAYTVSMFAPGRSPGAGQPIEVYGCRSSESLAKIIECLATGEKVPAEAVNS